MAVRGEGLMPTDGDDDGGNAAPSSAASSKVVYVLHPNCAVEEY